MQPACQAVVTPGLEHLRTIASRLLLVVACTSRFYYLLISIPERLYSVIVVLEKIFGLK